MSTSNKRKVTKQDVFAEPNDNEERPLIPQALTESDFAKYSTEMNQEQQHQQFLSPQAQEQNSGVQAQQRSKVQQVVGSFDELNGIVTPSQVKSIEKQSGKKVKLVSLEEAARQIQLEKEAMLNSMPEDAVMIQGIQGASQRTESSRSDGGGLINSSNNVYTLDSDQSTDEFQLMNSQTQMTLPDESQFDAAQLQANGASLRRPQTVTQNNNNQSAATGLIDPALLQQYGDGNSNDNTNLQRSHQQAVQASNSTVRVPMRAQLPPIFERSFEQSDMASSIGPANHLDLTHNQMQALRASVSKSVSRSSTQVQIQTNLMIDQQQHQVSAFRGSLIIPGSQNDSGNVFSPQLLSSSANQGHQAAASQQQQQMQFDRESGSAISTSPLLVKDQEKWPVQQNQTVIVVTRTYQEQETRRKRKIAIAFIVCLAVAAWLVYALLVILK